MQRCYGVVSSPSKNRRSQTLAHSRTSRRIHQLDWSKVKVDRKQPCRRCRREEMPSRNTKQNHNRLSHDQNKSQDPRPLSSGRSLRRYPHCFHTFLQTFYSPFVPSWRCFVVRSRRRLLYRTSRTITALLMSTSKAGILRVAMDILTGVTGPQRLHQRRGLASCAPGCAGGLGSAESKLM